MKSSVEPPSPGSDFPTAFSEALRAKKVSLAWLRSRLTDRGTPVSLTTLSYWRSGRRQPEGPASLRAVQEVEDLLGLTPLTLSSRLGPSRRPGPPRRQADVVDVVDDEAPVVHEALEALGLSGPAELAMVSLHTTVDVDEQRCVRAVTTSGVWRALVDAAQRLPLIYVDAAPLRSAPDISVAGGRLGRDCSRLAAGLVAHEFILDRPLDIKGEAVAEQRTVFREDVRETRYEHYFTSKLTEYTLWVRFHPTCLPSRVVGCTVADGEETTWDIDLRGTTNASVILRPFGPARAGIEWEW